MSAIGQCLVAFVFGSVVGLLLQRSRFCNTAALRDAIKAALKRYKNAERFLWVQEEPKNMGAWPYMLMNFDAVKLECISRPASGAPATGSSKRSAKQQATIIEQAFAKSKSTVKAGA